MSALHCLHDFTTSPYMYYTPCFVLDEQSVRHEQISVLINVFTLLTYYFLSTLLVLTLAMRELRDWPCIANMSP